MLIGNLRRYGALFATLGAIVSVAGCGGLSSAASCEDYVQEFSDLGSPEATEMVEDAYFDKFSDKDSVSGATLMENMMEVRQGCEENPEAKIDDFIEPEE